MQSLLSHGNTVRCLDLPTPVNRKRAHTFKGRTDVVWGDVRDRNTVDAAVRGQDVVVHLAFVLPPVLDEDPVSARAVNVDGTVNVLQAAGRHSARIVFASTLSVFGRTQHLNPPRSGRDPVAVTNEYSQHKITCEQLVRKAAVPWAIFRFADVPPKYRQKPVPLMYEIPLANRMELAHVDDVGLAIANGVGGAPIWGRTWLIGGGVRCQIRYRDLVEGSLAPLGIGALPDEAFTDVPFPADWLDTRESEEVLRYQRHSFDEIMDYVTRFSYSRVSRMVIPIVRPLIRRSLLKLSPYL
ncbi:NAD(P)-dependent oxidoreductase [Kibdelosporangium philippinense]|uniref:NAD(P)-dependent oxidoreductase n=1 Tax=Kibdelosporangium philippinense TaxID=211113 RepID=A0ABS8Z323_9PSEU|nr:NAD(P)-dependent oxidoreductase [Kibdelosporangium philippinense]